MADQDVILRDPYNLRAARDDDGAHVLMLRAAAAEGKLVILRDAWNVKAIRHDDGSHTLVVSIEGGGGGGGGGPVSWGDITNKPSGYTPIPHHHAIEDVDGLAIALAAKADADAIPAAATVASIIAGTGQGYLSPGPAVEALAPGVLAIVGGVATPDLAQHISWTLDLTGNVILANPVNSRPGQSFQVFVDRSAAQTLSFGAAYRGYGNVDLPATAGKGAVVTATVTSISPLVVRVAVTGEV